MDVQRMVFMTQLKFKVSTRYKLILSNHIFITDVSDIETGYVCRILL